ncbi:hypothetical protein M408DRAFT_22463 [Serendipita vermifera MAFF 305830]|uniref:DNA damage-binding protein 1 n=1 Tax=Serendipita vermifera MAFF 305830 TaxID=933852 RepID=A0A0C2XM40_SERVB|nr:hypothetical protein M408DRAFT_22463 [Serendipita vermifera MAFF 305830]
MHLISTYLPPPAASHALRCNLGEELLVVARINRLDVLELLPTGARPLSSLELLPRIIAVHEIALDDEPGALLVVTDHPDCSVLIVEFSIKERILVVKSSDSLVSAYGRPLAGCHPCAVSPDGQHAAVALHQGTINILSFSRRSGSIIVSSKFECPIREILLSGFCFMPFSDDEEEKLVLAFLHTAHTGGRQLTIRELDMEDREVSSNATVIDIRDERMDRIIPIVPSQSGGGGGLLVFGGSEILFFESKLDPKSPTKGRRQSMAGQRRPDAQLDWAHSDITGYGFIDENRLLLSDRFGKLMMLTMIRTAESKRIHKMTLHKFGECSAAKCIAYLNAGAVFLGSETGDSQLVKLNPTGDLSHVDTYQNVAPIVDAVLADLDNSDEPAIVTCSGGGHTGSLRIIRSGANIEELAAISGVEGVRNVFTLGGINGYHSHILLSFHDESKLIEIGKGSQFPEVSATEFPGVVRNDATLAAGSITGSKGEPINLSVQVTTTTVVLFDSQTGAEYAQWRGAITTADITGDSICVALKGGRVVSLCVNVDQARLDVIAEAKFHSEVSALSIQPIQPEERKPTLALLGFWEDNTVHICHFSTLQMVAGSTGIQMPHVPRSIMAWSFGASAHQIQLLVGTGNGNLVTLKVSSGKATIDMSSRRTTSLGDRPVYLYRCVVDEKTVVIATGGRTIVMSWNNGRVAQHHVNVKGLETTALLNHPTFPNSLLFKLSTGLVVARIGKLEKLKIETVPLGYDVPVTIAYHPEVKAFAIGCVRTEPSLNNMPDIVTSSFKLIDALTLEHLNSYTVGTSEEVTKVSILDLSVNDKIEKFIVVGTAIWEDNGNEPSKGRVLLFRAQMARSKPATANPAVPTVSLALDTEITGSVVAMGTIAGHLAVIVNTVLIVYRVRRNENTKEMDLQPVDQWAHNYALWSLVPMSPQHLVVGDSLQSVTVLKWNSIRSKLEVVARDWTSLASMNVTADEDYVIQSDIDGNLLSYQVESSGLQQKGHFFYGENISHMMPGSLSSVDSIDPSLPVPKHLLFTPGGRISIISKCPDSKAILMHNIQRNISAALKEDWFDLLAWRAPHTSMKRLPTTADDVPQTFGFVDGDLLARTLDIEEDAVIKGVLEGSTSAEQLGLEWRELRGLVEELQSTR